MQKCPDCHAQIDDEAVFCDQCGFQLKPRPEKRAAPPAPEMPPANPEPPAPMESISRSCPVCGYFNLPGEAYCTNCGSQLTSMPAISSPGEPFAAAANLACPSCGAQNPPGEAFCQVCGFGLAAAVIDAVAVQGDSTPVEIEEAPPSTSPPAASPFETAAAIAVPGRLHSPATDDSLPLPAKVEIIIGRSDPERGIYPDVDLSAAGFVPSSVISSVSRQHVRLVVQGIQVFIEDLNSTNSTFLNRQKLQPGQRYLLNTGDELRLGGVHLVFYSS